MGSMLTVITGAMARDPEMNYSDSGTAFTRISIPVNQFLYNPKTKKNEQVTRWINITLYGNIAEKCSELCYKGTIVSVSGSDYHDKLYKNNAGKTAIGYEMTANQIAYISGFGKARPVEEDELDLDELDDPFVNLEDKPVEEEKPANSDSSAKPATKGGVDFKKLRNNKKPTKEDIKELDDLNDHPF